MVDDIRMIIQEPLTPWIMNTDISNGTGIHWVSCIYLPDEKTFWEYDSLGTDNDRNNDNIVVRELRRFGLKRHLCKEKAQYDTNVWCGYFSILVCKHLQKLGIKTIRSCDEIVHKLFGDDNKPTNADEQTVINAFGRRVPPSSPPFQ